MKMIEKNGFPTFDEWVSESNNLRPRMVMISVKVNRFIVSFNYSLSFKFSYVLYNEIAAGIKFSDVLI